MKTMSRNRPLLQRGTTWRPLFALFLCLGFSSCYVSSVVALKDRDVKTREMVAKWKPVETAASIPGLYRSGTIEGTPAASLMKIFYYFDEDGSYTAAALLATSPPRFQVLSGHWTFKGGHLSLGEDEEPAQLDEFEDMLRISTQEGRVVLYREEIL